ncbi:hypothetical protein [Bradyrhizobium elkanii]|uniref:hypothetical protein n=1 Tax=Bradyrhizobium elkanii TaxID=29448 RepID=UPI0027151FAD|nr:hypothetical protein [Bradyrhizobium elkanii]WLB69552.1 hypothetical protein QIH89_30125 [Bradyrhizobium elkanii]
MGAAIATGLAVTFFIDSFALPSGLKPEGVLVEPWISDVDKLRNYIYAQHNDPSKHTIFVIAGSNSLFSIASEEITKSTGYNVNNYGLHVGLHPDLLFSQITTKVKPGDIVVAPWSGLIVVPSGTSSISTTTSSTTGSRFRCPGTQPTCFGRPLH